MAPARMRQAAWACRPAACERGDLRTGLASRSLNVRPSLGWDSGAWDSPLDEWVEELRRELAWELVLPSLFPEPQPAVQPATLRSRREPAYYSGCPACG